MSSQAIIQARVFHGSKTNELIYSRNSISRIPELSVGFSRSKNVFVKHMHSKNAQCRAVRKNEASDDDTSPPIPTNRETDMEALLNKMSLEYDSVWDTKPAWCQPWTITLTGIVGVGGSWQVIHSPILTGLVSFAVFVWWYVFLYAYPKAYQSMIAERRARVAAGVEDTYGSSIQ